ncbi:MAG TPA: amino acid permease, partial [Acidobacteriota bacterium]|nr:amino acid permease [Acidobacteriota bacterium]
TACGLITLCGALTLAELSSLIPSSGATYHIIREGIGPFWGFLKIWMEMWVNSPGSIAGVAAALGEFAAHLFGNVSSGAPLLWGIGSILFFTAINLLGVRWGGWTQIVLTAIKVAALLVLIGGSLLLVRGSVESGVSAASTSGGWMGLMRVIGLGIAAVLFTYDGWIDVTHTAGEVAEPKRTLPIGLAGGVLVILTLYLLANYAYLRIVPLQQMREKPDLIASTVALRTFGSSGDRFLTALMAVSIFGALGGIVMTAPRLIFAVAERYASEAETPKRARSFFGVLASVSPRTSVPWVAILVMGGLSIVALLFFRSFSRLANFFLVPVQLSSILMVASIFRLRKRTEKQPDQYRTPGYPWVPLLFIAVMSLFLINAIVYNPKDTLIGITLAATALPVYRWIGRS